VINKGKIIYTYRTATQYYSSLSDSYPQTEAGCRTVLFLSKGLALIGRWGFQRCHRKEWSRMQLQHH